MFIFSTLENMRTWCVFINIIPFYIIAEEYLWVWGQNKLLPSIFVKLFALSDILWTKLSTIKSKEGSSTKYTK